MKVNKKLLLLFIILSFLFVPFTFAEEIKEEENVYINEDTQYTAEIVDQADLLTKDEEFRLLQDMKELTQFGNIVFVSTNDNNYSTEYYARNYYHQNYSTENGSLFLIDMSNREIYIFSDGSNYNIITESKAYSITDNVYRYASNGQYYLCASDAFSQMNTLLNGNKILEPMRFASNIFIALTVSFFLTFLFVLSQTKIRKASVSEITEKCDISFNMGTVTPKKNGTKKVYSPMSTDSHYTGGSSGGYSGGSHSSGGFSGGGHSGGGFSGGGHSGGGGGHRF